ncbi:MAG: polysaccharide biosynthesis tyrosine autokinase [Bacteroidales bacterium]|nr:polysaccharide biosynthesis tyrosine autokinase [Bacteroidales bacterium]
MAEIPNQNNEQNNSIDIKLYLSKIAPKWYIYLISLTICLIYAYYQNKHVIPQYCSNATLLLKTNNNPQNIIGLNTMIATVDLENEISQLKSNTLARMTLQKLNFETTYYQEGNYSADKELYTNKPFEIEYDTQHTQIEGGKIWLRFIEDNKFSVSINEEKKLCESKIGEWIETEKLKFKVNLSPGTPKITKNKNYYFIKNNFDKLVASYSSKLNVSQKRQGSSIVTLTLYGEVPEKQEDYLNTLSLTYLEYGLSRKNKILLQTISFIDTMLTSLGDSLDVAQKKITPKIESSETEIKEQIITLKNEIQETIIRQNYYKYLKNEFEKQTDLTLIATPTLANVNEPTIDNFLEKLTEKLTEKNKLEFSIREGQNIAPYSLNDYETKTIINQCINYVNLADSLLEIKKKQLNIQILQLNSTLQIDPSIEWDKMKITKKYDLNNELYNNLLSKRYDAEIALASSQPDTEIIDAATWITRYSIAPLGTFSYAKAIIIALAIPSIIIFLMIFLENKITDISEIERTTKQTPIGTIFHNRHKTNLPVVEYPNSSITEAFRALRTNLQFIDTDNKHKIILFTSTNSGEGKTFTSVNTAIITAANEKKVLLIGLDLRKPKIQEYFKLPNNKGISTYLIGESTYEETIIKTEYKNLDFVLPGPIPPNPSELIGSEKMIEFINKAKQNYDFIFIDSAPVGIVTDALLLKNIVSSYIFVIRQNYTFKSALKLFTNLKNEGYPKLNLIFNGIKQHYGKGYGYHYYNSYYGKYYGGYYDEGEHKKNFLKKLFSKK